MNAAALNSLSSTVGIRFHDDILADMVQSGSAYPLFTLSPVTATLVRHRLTTGLRRLKLINACTLSLEKGSALAFGNATSFTYTDTSRKPDPNNRRGDTPFIAALDYGKGKIVCIGDYHILSSEAPFEHEVLILKGEGMLKNDGPDIPFSEGSAIYIAPNEIHQLVNTGRDTLRFVCSVPLRGEY